MFNEHLMIHLEYKISAESLVLLFKPISQSDSSHSSIKYFFLLCEKQDLGGKSGTTQWHVEFTGFLLNNMAEIFH